MDSEVTTYAKQPDKVARYLFINTVLSDIIKQLKEIKASLPEAKKIKKIVDFSAEQVAVISEFQKKLTEKYNLKNANFDEPDDNVKKAHTEFYNFLKEEIDFPIIELENETIDSISLSCDGWLLFSSILRKGIL